MIEMIPALPDNVLGFIAKGEVTAQDYETTLDPEIERALESHDKIRLLYVLGEDFTGFSGGAMWADGKVGMKHFNRWERIAVVSDKDWIRHTIDSVGWLLPAKVRTFHVSEEADASAWVTS
ncbi:MAG: STAS/SEC14 domain-containing protein [Acidimicrobiia bacterium]|nr:STAS/SEC14 domain-containing protein [Acidimicrobiia bacterium]